MARKKVTILEINSWEEADSTLQRIAVLRNQIDGAVALYNKEEQERRLLLTKQNAPFEQEITHLETGLKQYCEANRMDFGKLKTRELQHGSVGFRNSPPKVATLRGFTFKSALEVLKRSPYRPLFVRTKEEIDKEAILAATQRKVDAVSAEELAEFGLAVRQDETFGYELKLAVE